MAEDQGQSKTEAPTQRRLEEALSQGQVAISAEFAMAVLLLAGTLVLLLGARTMARGLLDGVRENFLAVRRMDFGVDQVQRLFCGLLSRGGEVLGVFFGLTVAAGLGVSFVQSGFHFSPGILAFRWEKLSPTAGWQRMLSGQAWVRGLVFCFKAALAFAIVFWILQSKAGRLTLLPHSTLAATTADGWSLAMRLSLMVAVVFLVLGAADFLYQRWRHTSNLMMTRQEMKEEMKRDEGDPLLKARIRRLQREAVRKQMMKDVPRASVVITNPTHLAIALRYERGTMKAPRVVAKGAGHIAERIIELARRHAVPVVERKPVARALYKAVNVGQEIPAALYYAVAEVLAYLHRLRNAG